VTRLGEFSPIGWLFTWVMFLKLALTEVIEQIFGVLFSWKTWYIHFDKKWVGLHIGRSFHKPIRSPWRSLAGDFDPLTNFGIFADGRR
jgi:hypothetical protein